MTLLLHGLLVHLVDQHVDVLAHLLQLVTQLLVLRLQELLLLLVIPECLDEFGRLSHLLQLLPCLLQRLLNKLVRVALLQDLLVIQHGACVIISTSF